MTVEMARLPTRASALARAASDGGGTLSSEAVWMEYLDEQLSDEDMIVLLVSGDVAYSHDFGPPPQALGSTIVQLEEDQREAPGDAN